MEVVAKLRGAQISAQKTRLVADLIRGMPVERALDTLKYSDKSSWFYQKSVGFSDSKR